MPAPILHTHMPNATALACVEDGRIEPIYQSGLRFFDRVTYDDHFHGLALSDAEGDRIAAAMGNNPVCLMGNHGVLVTGRDMALGFDTLYYLERQAMIQIKAMSTGQPLKRVPDHMAAKSASQIEGEEQQSYLLFESIKRVLDKEAPDYRSF